MEAEIKYSRVITLLDSEEVSVGFLQYKKPKLVNVNFFPPRNEINVIDGSYIWIYHIEERQVEKYEMSGDADSPQGVDIFELGYDYTVEKVKTNYEMSHSWTSFLLKKKHYSTWNLFPGKHSIQNTTGHYYGSKRGSGCRCNINYLRVTVRL